MSDGRLGARLHAASLSWTLRRDLQRGAKRHRRLASRAIALITLILLLLAVSCGDLDGDTMDGEHHDDAQAQRWVQPPTTMFSDTRMSLKTDHLMDSHDPTSMSILGDSPKACRMACLEVFVDCVRDACGHEPSAQCFNQAAPICSSAVNECRRCCEIPLSCR